MYASPELISPSDCCLYFLFLSHTALIHMMGKERRRHLFHSRTKYLGSERESYTHKIQSYPLLFRIRSNRSAYPDEDRPRGDQSQQEEERRGRRILYHTMYSLVDTMWPFPVQRPIDIHMEKYWSNSDHSAGLPCILNECTDIVQRRGVPGPAETLSVYLYQLYTM